MFNNYCKTISIRTIKIIYLRVSFTMISSNGLKQKLCLQKITLKILTNITCKKCEGQINKNNKIF